MRALLVDGLNMVRRIHAAVRPDKVSDDPDIDTDAASIAHTLNAVGGSLRRALRFHEPSHCVAVFEQQGRTWRHRLFPDYKKNRSPMPPVLAAAMDDIKNSFAELGVQSIDRAGYEADDVIATMATRIAENAGKVTILSTDRNYCQLLSEHIQVYDHFGQRYLDREMVFKRFGVEPDQLPLLLAMAGDSGLSIPGIPGVGVRTAARLIAEYGDLERLLEASRDMAGKIGTKVFNGAEAARVGLELFTLRRDIELGINLSQFRYTAEIN